MRFCHSSWCCAQWGQSLLNSKFHTQRFLDIKQQLFPEKAWDFGKYFVKLSGLRNQNAISEKFWTLCVALVQPMIIILHTKKLIYLTRRICTLQRGPNCAVTVLEFRNEKFDRFFQNITNKVLDQLLKIMIQFSNL